MSETTVVDIREVNRDDPDVVKERPILMSAPMIKAILSGAKTQTRRVLKQALHPAGVWAGAVLPASESGWVAWWPGKMGGLAEFTKQMYQVGFPCPFGTVGESLWVRETWARICDHEEPCEPEDEPLHYIEYRADTGNRYPGDWPQEMEPSEVPLRWRPSIFMPRAASRITLEVTGVRVERIQDISIEDVLAEGVPEQVDTAHNNQYWREETGDAFVRLWDSINAARGYSWDANPWVWVVEFKRVEP